MGDFYGQNYDTLKQLAFSASGRLQQVKGLTDVKIRMREDEPEVVLNVDYHRLAAFGLTTYYFSNTLHCQLRGLIATQYRTEGKQIETICNEKQIDIANKIKPNFKLLILLAFDSFLL